MLIGCGTHVPASLEARREGSQARGSESLRFTVWDLTKDEPAPIGTTAVRIDPDTRTGEFFILLGTAEARGRGLGTEATRLTLDYAFHVANLACVHLTVKAPNTRAIRAYEAAGFRWIGQRRNSAYWFGQRCDEVLMDCVPADYAGTSEFRSLFYGPAKADT